MREVEVVTVRIGKLGRSIRSVAGHLDHPYLPRRGQWLALAALTLFVIVGVILRQPRDLFLTIPVGIATVAAGRVMLTAPDPLRLVCAALATAGVAVICNATPSNVGWFAVCVLGVICALTGGSRDALIYLAGAIVLFAVQWLWIEPDPGWGAWMAGTTLSVLAALLIRHELDLVAQLRAAQAGLTERARAEERNRIARELHDVIAHTLTVSLLHVTSARLAVEEDPADAARALAEAERLNRESLTEVRAAVGLLRPDVSPGERARPLPTIDGLPSLIDRFREAGANITLTIHGDTSPLPATTGLAVYRIAQEALTNAAKHAPGAPIAVDLTVDRGAVGLCVDSAGEPGNGTGIGMISMRERAAAVGGTCEAGPGGQGWIVRASLPVNGNGGQENLT